MLFPLLFYETGRFDFYSPLFFPRYFICREKVSVLFTRFFMIISDSALERCCKPEVLFARSRGSIQNPIRFAMLIEVFSALSPLISCFPVPPFQPLLHPSPSPKSTLQHSTSAAVFTSPLSLPPLPLPLRLLPRSLPPPQPPRPQTPCFCHYSCSNANLNLNPNPNPNLNLNLNANLSQFCTEFCFAVLDCFRACLSFGLMPQ